MPRFLSVLAGRCHRFLSSRTLTLLLALGVLGAANPALAHFQDDFNRADSSAIGNGWIEKTDGAFAISANRAVKQTVGTGYRDNLVYRPASENVLNVEAAAELTFTGAPGYAQIAVRVQTGTVANADTLDSYLLYIDNSTTRVILGRQNGNAFVTTLATINLTTEFNTTDRFRLRLAARNTNPVLVDGYVERLVGSIWQTIGQANVSDASAQRIATAGSVGFGGYVENTYAFDNFTRVDLGATGTANPAPTTVALSPTQAAAGESGLTLTVYGSGFTTDSVVRWNGSNRTTTYVSPSELEATITAADLATTGTRNVTVFNPTPGGGTSAAQTFTVVNPTAVPPAITSMSPNSATAGGQAFTLTVNGTGFNSGSVVRWNGANRTTTFVSSSQLTAAITAADIANAGSAAVTVLRVSDGQTSSAATFTIDPPPPGIDFTDTFTRADSPNVGNGWIEKTPDAFSILNNEVSKSGGGWDYRDNLVYRPASENALDVEASIEIRFTSTNVGYPQIFVRGQTSTIGNMGTMDAYLLYVNSSPTQAVLARQRGTNWDIPLSTFNFTAFNTTDRYRLRLRATGTNPVALAAFVERWSGSAWTIIGQTTFNDSDASRITTPGSVGFGGYIETTYRMDNFTRAAAAGVGTSNPVPAISGLAPSSATAGSGAFTLTVNGSNFVNGAVVRWNGADRTTTFVSATQLQAAINAADIASQGTANVTVFNPAPGGGTSGTSTFSITAPATNPVPVATSLSPSSAAAGGGAFTLTVNGSNFINGSVVRWNGSNRTTTFVSSTQLQAAITAADISSTGTRTVTVFNPSPGGGTSGNLTFTVNTASNPVPQISNLSPNSVSAGSPAFTLTVNGSNFVAGSVVRWNGSSRSTTFVSSTQLTASISASDIASQGNRTVTVFNPSPGGGTSNSSTFSVTAPSQTNPVPVLTSTSPTSWPTGGGAFTLVVNGSNFTSQSVVHWNGNPRSTTVVSANELRASITSSDVASAGLAAITVVTPSPGGGRSVPTTFFIQDGAITYFYDHFNRPDSQVVGNNWTEKNPDAFFLQNNAVSSNYTTSAGFTNDIMHRPLGDVRQDMEVSVEFTRLLSIPNEFEANWPQVHARVQPSTVGLPWSLDSYIFFFDDSAPVPRAAFAVTRALPNPGDRIECYIAPVNLPSWPEVGTRYRLRFRVSGTSPVVLQGWVDRYSNGAWQEWASGQTQHTNATQPDPNLYCDPGMIMPPPITNPGIAGVAKWINRTDTYDNFYVRDLAPLAPAPNVTSLSPSSATAGGPQFTLTVNGSGFQPGATVRWNGASRSTTYVSSTQVRATITAADIASAGTASVTVINSGSQESSPRTFTINEAAGSTTFSDTFDRADNAALGNGWIEKTPDTWRLMGNRVDKVTSSAGYRNNIVYRPASEDALDVEARMEFRIELASVGYPAILARVQQATANAVNGFDGYLMFMDSSPNTCVIARQRADGNWETRLASFNLNTPLQVGQTYRMRLRVMGTTSVQLTGTVEQLINGTWTAIGTGQATDTSSQRISTPGAVGFTGDNEDAYNFDNFSRSNLN